MGQLQTYDLRCELFEYSNERFETGIPEVDEVLSAYVTTTQDAIDNIENYDVAADNTTIETIADDFLDFTESNPFGEDIY